MENLSNDTAQLGADEDLDLNQAVVTLVVKVDTTQLDAALAKAEQLKVALAGLAAVSAGTLSLSASDVAELRTEVKGLRT